MGRGLLEVEVAKNTLEGKYQNGGLKIWYSTYLREILIINIVVSFFWNVNLNHPIILKSPWFMVCNLLSNLLQADHIANYLKFNTHTWKNSFKMFKIIIRFIHRKWRCTVSQWNFDHIKEKVYKAGKKWLETDRRVYKCKKSVKKIIKSVIDAKTGILA